MVAHFHYVLVPGAQYYGIIAGVYYWLPKWTGNMYNETTWAKPTFGCLRSSSTCFVLPNALCWISRNAPRRIPDYAVQFADFNAIATVGAFGFGFSQILLLVLLIIKCIRGGEKATDQVWEGARRLGVDAQFPPSIPFVLRSAGY